MRLLKYVIALWAVLSLFCAYSFAYDASASDTAAGNEVLVDTFGTWTLEQLGYSELTLASNERESASISYLLLDEAAQGPDNWYVVHMDFVIEFSEQSEAGRCYVTAAANNYTCAQIKFETRREEAALIIDYSTVDLLNGYTVWTTRSRTISVSFSNYLTVTGVKPGTNMLTFAVETYEGADVSEIRILPSSGIEFTPMSPPDLKLEIVTPENPLKVGEEFGLGFKLKNIGDMPAKGVVVRVIYPIDALDVIGPESYQIDELDTTLEGQFQFKALEVGQHSLIVDVQTNSGIKRPSGRLVVPVAESSSYYPIGAIAASIAFGCLVIYVLIARRRRHNRSVRR